VCMCVYVGVCLECFWCVYVYKEKAEISCCVCVCVNNCIRVLFFLWDLCALVPLLLLLLLLL